MVPRHPLEPHSELLVLQLESLVLLESLQTEKQLVVLDGLLRILVDFSTALALGCR